MVIYAEQCSMVNFSYSLYSIVVKTGVIPPTVRFERHSTNCKAFSADYLRYRFRSLNGINPDANRKMFSSSAVSSVETSIEDDGCSCAWKCLTSRVSNMCWFTDWDSNGSSTSNPIAFENLDQIGGRLDILQL